MILRRYVWVVYQATGGGSGTLLATFTYDPSGVPESVVVGTDPVNGPRYYYVYNGHGDVVALTDTSGTVVASYSYDVWGTLTSSSENIPNANGWTNPYRYDGKDGARYDGETGLYWLSTRAYDPTLGRFLQRDPLGRMPLFFWDQPYVYAGNNPLINTDPSGELITRWGGGNLGAAEQTRVAGYTARVMRVQARHPAARQVTHLSQKDRIHNAEGIAGSMGWTFGFIAAGLGALAGLVELLNALLQTDAFANILSIFGAALGVSEEVIVAQLNVLAAFIAALGFEAGILTVMFAWEANQTDSWWANPGNVSDFAATVVAVTSVFMAIFGTIAAIVRRVIGGLPAGAKWANFGIQIGSVIATLGSIIFAGMAVRAVNDEQQELGYT